MASKPNINQLLENLKKYESEEEDLEIYDVCVEIIKYYLKELNFNKAEEYITKALSKAIGVNKKIEINLFLLQIYLKSKDITKCEEVVIKCRDLVKEGADWEKKNKFKTYEGLYFILIRDIKNASLRLTDSISTFDSEEIISYKELIFYAVFTSFISQNRSFIKKNIIDNSECLSVLIDIKPLYELLSQFFKCNYYNIFSNYILLFDMVKSDFYLKDHYKYLIKNSKVIIFRQYLEAFKTVTLDNMAEAFRFSKEFLDKELSELISSGLLNCKIDKISGIIESTNIDNKNKRYNNIIKTGDNILSRLQKLSKYIEA